MVSFTKKARDKAYTLEELSEFVAAAYAIGAQGHELVHADITFSGKLKSITVEDDA